VVDVLVEPQRPAPLLSIVGESPAARKLAELARAISWRTAGQLDPRADAVVVASMGQGDEEAVEAALAGPAGYVGLVASARRAAKVAAGLRSRGVPESALARLRSPAGLDLGHCTQEEIAVAIMAELVAWRHARSSAGPAEATDPVCGMAVVADSLERTSFAGVGYAFCGPACRRAFEADPERYAGSTSALRGMAS
jgi:xanthine dehydrogenase accessory factor